MMKLKCVKCGHLWIARKEKGLPIACPNCNNRKWIKYLEENGKSRRNLEENEVQPKSVVELKQAIRCIKELRNFKDDEKTNLKRERLFASNVLIELFNIKEEQENEQT